MIQRLPQLAVAGLGPPQQEATALLIWWNSKHALQRGMSSQHNVSQNGSGAGRSLDVRLPSQELPLTVRDAAAYLGVSVQTVYLWVERKQIPHLRVMGRNIRFLRTDLEPFRAQFKQEVGNGTT